MSNKNQSKKNNKRSFKAITGRRPRTNFAVDAPLAVLDNPAQWSDGVLTPKAQKLVREHNGRWRPENAKDLVDYVQALVEDRSLMSPAQQDGVVDFSDADMFYVSKPVVETAREAGLLLEPAHVKITADLLPSEKGVVAWYDSEEWVQSFSYVVRGGRLYIHFRSVLFVSQPMPRGIPEMGAAIDLGQTADAFEALPNMDSNVVPYTQECLSRALAMLLFMRDRATFPHRSSTVRVSPSSTRRSDVVSTLGSELESDDGLRVVKTVALAKSFVSAAETATSTVGGHAPGSKHSYMYQVRGHWRRQWCPSTRTHQDRYIPSHFRGKGKLRRKALVTIV